MSRRILFLLLLPLALALPLHAQHGERDEFAWQDMISPYYPPDPLWVADMKPSDRYPITVRVWLEANHYNGADYAGTGEAHIFNPAAEDVEFKYRCGVTFAPYRGTEFYARWVTPGRKLEIRLRRPGSDHTRTCRITTSAVSSQKAPTHS